MVALIAATMMWQEMDPWTTVWFDRPVRSEQQWTDAFPVGNGRMGAMAFGVVAEERILINEGTYWAKGEVPVMPEDAFDHVTKARELAFAGDMVAAEAEIRQAMAPRISPRSYQPLGWLTIETGGEALPPLVIQGWTRRVGTEWVPVDLSRYEIAEGATEVFRTVFQIRRVQTEDYNTLNLSPIDDRSVISVNGRKVGETADWNQGHQFSLGGLLRPGSNELVVEVTNVGGAGHGPAETTLTATDAPDGYQRALDMATGVNTIRYRRDDGVYTQEVLASPVDDVIAVRLATTEPQGLDCVVGFETQTGTLSYLEDGFVVRGQARHSDGREGVKAVTVVKIDFGGGQFDEGRISGTSEAVLYLSVATDYNKEDPERPRAVTQLGPARTVARAAVKGWEAVKRDSVVAQREAFDRCFVKLGSETDARAKVGIPVDQRIEDYKSSGEDHALESLLFAYGRYLLISSSRPGTMPANLQGIWNPHLEAPWNSDYHTNINLQMNYWPSLVTGLSEFQMPLFDYLDGIARNDGRRMAKVLGSDGFAIGHTTDAWGWAAMTGEPVWGAWVIGGGWMAQHYMEQYRFTGDKSFLEERAWPFLKGSAEFFLGWLVEDPETGKLVSGPVTSAENRF